MPALELGGHEISPACFPLVTLGAKLQSLAHDLHRGKGFFVLRGLDVNKYSAEDNVLIYLGIASYIGDKRAKQNGDGDMLSTFNSSRQVHF